MEKRRKTRILRLEQKEGLSKEKRIYRNTSQNIIESCLPRRVEGFFSLNESEIADIQQVFEEENRVLLEEFTEMEVREAIFQMKHNKAPGPDEFPAEFYQVFSSLIKEDLMAMFKDFYSGNLPLYTLNFGVVTSLPKMQEAKMIQQYRPICMLNVSFKIFTKLLANRFTSVANRIIKPSQTAFLPGMFIMEGIVILHESLHEIKRKHQNGIRLKLDIEKAYDKVDWGFLQQTLRMKGFSAQWCRWVESIVTGGSVGVKVNDEIGKFFHTKKGLRQGDPLSPILFNIVADMLAVLVSRARNAGQLNGVVPHMVDEGLTILQYVNDTILSVEDDIEQAKNLKLVLGAFEELSGLKINFHKSENFCLGQAKNRATEYIQLVGSKEGTFPFMYLGIPMSHGRITNKNWS